MTDVGFLLKLKDGLEDEFWASPASVQHLVTIDNFGLSLGAVSNFCTYRMCRRPGPRIMFVLSMILQAIQLLWLWLAKDSYMPRRQRVQLLQRLRFLSTMFFVGIYISGIERASMQNAAAPPKGLKAVLVATLLAPVFNMVSFLHHHLPFRFQVPFILALPVMELYGRFQQQQRIIKVAELDEGLHQACVLAHQVLLIPLTMDDAYSQKLCADHAPTFIIVLATLLIGTILPLCIAYTLERAAKHAFLVRRKLEQASARASAGDASAAAVNDGIRDVQLPGPIGLREVWGLAAAACSIASVWTEWL